jgi:hypothetical protein
MFDYIVCMQIEIEKKEKERAESTRGLSLNELKGEFELGSP